MNAEKKGQLLLIKSRNSQVEVKQNREGGGGERERERLSSYADFQCVCTQGPWRALFSGVCSQVNCPPQNVLCQTGTADHSQELTQYQGVCL